MEEGKDGAAPQNYSRRVATSADEVELPRDTPFSPESTPTHEEDVDVSCCRVVPLPVTSNPRMVV